MSNMKGVYHTDAPAPLDTILEALLHRRIWTPEQARAHMDAELAAAPKASRLWRFRTAIQATLNTVGMAGLAVGGVSLFACALLSFGWFIGLYLDPIWQLWTGTALGFSAMCVKPLGWWILGLVGGCAAFAAFLYVGDIYIRGPAEWIPHTFDQVAKDVWARMPDEVKCGGEATLMLMPGAELTVYVLKQDGCTLDPVLEVACINPVTFETEYAYPFVWDKSGKLVEPH